MYEHDERIVMTLDAGGTNFVFSAIQGCREIVEPICLPAASDDLERCLSVLVEGFLEVEKRLPKLPVLQGRSGTWTLFEGTVWYSGFY